MEAMQANAAQAVALLKQLANEKRLWILCQLIEKEMTVSELNACVDLSQSALSQHLSKLRADGLVTPRKEGLSVYYSLKSEEVKRILSTLHSIYCA